MHPATGVWGDFRVKDILEHWVQIDCLPGDLILLNRVSYDFLDG
jgi:hypothetical protein